MANGKLIVNSKKQVRVKFINSKGNDVEMPVPDAELSRTLKTEPIEKLDGRDVELDVEKGQPRRVRPLGIPFASPSPAPTSKPDRGGGSQGRGRVQHQQHSQVGQRPGRQAHERTPGPKEPPAYHNPYNFVRALPRDAVSGELGDAAPVGHHRYHADRMSGVIRVRMTLGTPLLLPDASRVVDCQNDHKSVPLRVDADGQPYVPPTSIKGMLRSAYEAVTNSRLAVFAGHSDRLANRMPASDGLALVPAIITQVNGAEAIELLPGTSEISGAGRPAGGQPMFAAWLPRYDRNTGQVASFAVRYPDNGLPQHGDAVHAWLELWEKSGKFSYWLVRQCVRVDDVLDTQPAPGTPRGAHRPVGKPMMSVRGFVCVTNRNIDRKHDERVFFTTRSAPFHHSITPQLRRRWQELITNYQDIHQAERESGKTAPPALNDSTWSRHVVGGQRERQLSLGTLCYAAFHEGTVTALYPVMISRRLFEVAPLSLLPTELRPATARAELSPAERVFGWVSQNGSGAYRGNVRVGPVTCETPDAIEPFGAPGLPLAILGEPKPQQARFYVAESINGEAQTDGLSKEDTGYRQGKGLRGRKVYPHHRDLPEGYWTDPTSDRTQQQDDRTFQEYRRPTDNGREQRDNQNRSVQGWVKAGTLFTFDLHVANLSRVELGGLLWLLSLEPEHYHRLGGGKPLGFGSARLEIDAASSRLHDGMGVKQFYSTLDDCSPPLMDRAELIDAFKHEVANAYGEGQPFERVHFIAAFLRMAKGFDDKPTTLPLHYPRARHDGAQGPQPPLAEGLAYEWFVANDRQQGGEVVNGYALRDLVDQKGVPDPGLPMLDAPH